jgi:hypothetical protein
MSITHGTSVRTGIADYVVDLIDAGSAAGKLKFYTANFASLMTTLTFSDPAFAAASNGSATMTAGAITGTISLAGTNTMAKFRITDSDDNTVMEGDVGTSGADINLTSVSFNQNDTVTINSLTYQAAP